MAALFAVNYSYAQFQTLTSGYTTTTDDVGIGTTSPLSGGSAARWLTANGNTTYGGGLISSIGGTAKGFYYYDGSTGSLAVQGTTGVDVTLQPNGSTALIAKSNGNIGIGNINPTIAKLEVNGLIATDITGNNQYSLNSIGANFGFLLNNAANTWSLGYGLTPSVMGSSVLTWNSAGNVGIGTTSPNALLSFGMPIVGALKTYTTDNQSGISSYILNTGDIGGYLDIYANRSGDGSSQGGSTIRFLSQGYTDTGPLAMERMRIAQNGNVGIGTTDPQGYKLAVNGTIHSKAVLIDLTGWPDYVFNSEYRLQPLAAVKSYIDENHHLPEMPSAAEVEKDGLNVGEMNKLLTKKVEELTLYLIDRDRLLQQQDAALKKQAKTADRQQQQIDELQQRLEKLINNHSDNDL